MGWQFCDIFWDMTADMADMVDGGSNPPLLEIPPIDDLPVSHLERFSTLTALSTGRVKGGFPPVVRYIAGDKSHAFF